MHLFLVPLLPVALLSWGFLACATAVFRNKGRRAAWQLWFNIVAGFAAVLTATLTMGLRHQPESVFTYGFLFALALFCGAFIACGLPSAAGLWMMLTVLEGRGSVTRAQWCGVGLSCAMCFAVCVLCALGAVLASRP